MNPFEGYRTTSPYGPRRHPVTGVNHFHTGIDLVKAHKSPIFAFTNGQVMYAGDGKPGTGFGGFGLVVAVKDKKGSLHCYVHLDSVSVAVGQTVKSGQEVGKQGATGRVTGSHLHYEVRKVSSPSNGWTAREEDRCYDPTQYLMDYYKSIEVETMYRELLEKVNKQQNQIDALSKQVQALQNRNSMDPPEWAKPAVQVAVDAGLIDTPNGGSYDFYRLITVLHRNGLLTDNS